MKEKRIGRFIGIDLGTTSSCIAVWKNGKAVIIPNSEGANTTPSVVAFLNGEWIVGNMALRQAAINPDRTIFSVKRDLGTARSIHIEGKEYTPQEILAIILQKLKQDAETYLGEAVTHAVITIPSCFSDSQRRAIVEAGRIAGLEVPRVINGPSAAALAYGFNKKNEEIILVYDLGGGMFSVTVLDIGDGAFLVLATAGSTCIGGDDFDQRITDFLSEGFKQKNGIDLRKDKMTMQRLREAAEKAKIELTEVVQTTVNLQYVAIDESGPKHLDVTITRKKFDDLVSDLVRKTKTLTQKCLADAGRSAMQVDKLILVGGSSRIPQVQEMIKKTFGKDPSRGLYTDECFAAGAAIECGVLTGEIQGTILLDVLPFSIGIETAGDVFTKLIEHNTTIPTLKKGVFSVVSKHQTEVVIRVLQGEHSLAHLNEELGCFHMTGIAPTQHGVPQIEITLDIDERYDIHVSAKDLGTGNEQKLNNITANDLYKMKTVPKAVKVEQGKWFSCRGW